MNPYSPESTTKTAQSFDAYYTTDINALVSSYLRSSHDVSKRLYNEVSIGHIAINALTRYVIGQGLSPSSSPERSLLDWTDEEAAEFVRSAEAFFRSLADSRDLDYYRKQTFKRMQIMAFKNILIAGDVLLHRSYSDRARRYKPYVQVISGTWVQPDGGEQDTKTRTAGVELDEKGREKGYYIAETDANRFDTLTSRYVSKFNPRTGFEEYDLILLEQQEANQIRGIPLLTAVKEDMLLAASFNKSYVTKALVQSLFTAFLESQQENDNTTMNVIRQAGENPEEFDDDGITLSSGGFVRLQPGEKVDAVESKVAGVDYATFMKTMLSLISTSIGVPYEMFLQSYNASFSASRATIASAEKGFRIFRDEFAEKFCQPCWEMVVDYGIRTGHIKARGYLENPDVRKAILACTWIGPSQVSIDQTKEVTACKTAMEAGIMSKEYAVRSLYGLDYDEVFDRITQEREKEGKILEEEKIEESEDEEEVEE